MRILFVTRKFPPSVGGMEVYAEELFAALGRTDQELIIFKPDPPILGRPKLGRLSRFFARAAAAVFRNASKVDIVFLGDAVLVPLAWVAKLRRRSVVTVVAAHGNDVYYAQGSNAASVFYRAMLKLFSRTADLLIANSSDTQLVAASLGFRNAARVPLGTRLNFNPQVHAANRDSILFAGRLMHCKGLAWFLREVMPKVDSHINLLVAGPPWDPEEMESVRECPRARYLGSLSQEELAQLRAQVLACIMPNLPARLSGQNEGFGLSALESAAAGTPVVASKLGGLAEAVLDGVTGFLIEPLDARAFASCINAIAAWDTQRRIRFAARARQTISERFTWDRVANDYLRHFESLVRSRGERA